MFLKSSLAYQFNITVFTYKWLNDLTTVVCMLVVISLGLEYRLALRAVKFDAVVRLLHFSILPIFTDLAAWLLCMRLCIP